MAQFNSKNQSSRVARRWFTDIDVNMTLHPQSGDVTLKQDINSIKRSVRNLISTNYYLTLIKIQPYSLDILVHYLHLVAGYLTEKPRIHFYS